MTDSESDLQRATGNETSFVLDQFARVRPLWDAMLSHQFLIETRDGTIADATFARWMREDYLFVEHGLTFLGALLARAPRAHRASLVDAIQAFHMELQLFVDQAKNAGVDVVETAPAFADHAYMQFLTATAQTASYAEAYTVLYTAERAYHDSWCFVAASVSKDWKWYPFVANWAGASFGEYVAVLERELDTLARDAGVEERGRMAALFETTVRYEIAFWEMAYTASKWPGIDSHE